MKASLPVSINESQNDVIPSNFLSSISVRSRDFAIQYLETSDILKPQFNRLVSWFLKFKLLSEDCSKWHIELNKLRKEYINDLKSCVLDTSAIDLIDGQLPAIIPRDLNRSIQLFGQFADCLRLDSNFLNDSTLRIHRIFYFLHKNDESFEYIQGYDRFVYFSLCISLSFCLKLELDEDSAEAFAYHLAKGFIKNISIAHLVLHPDESILIMEDLFDFLKLSSPATAAAFISQSISSQMYAMNYLLLLFEEQHNPFETLILWDMIVLHCNNNEQKMKMINSIAVAHLVQCQIGVTPPETIQRIVQKKDFNFQRLINDTNRFYSDKHVYEGPVEKSGGIPPGIVMIIAISILAGAGVLLYKLMKD